MTPTVRATEIAAVATPMLDAAASLLNERGPFYPAKSQRTFTLIGSDYIEFAFLPLLCCRLEREAPSIAITQRPANPSEAAAWMQSGQVDLGIGSLDNPPPTLKTCTLFSDEQVCVVRKGHPAARAKFPATDYASLGHIAVAPGGAGFLGKPIDAMLQSLGLSRRVAVMVPSFLAVPYVVASTDYVATVPRRIAQKYSAMVQLQLLDPPVRLPAFKIGLFWHERVDADPANRWLRRQVVEVATEFRRATA
jgi:DNA-binding transcriptional LysR family regulator